MAESTTVIVGAGLAGCQAAVAAREQGYDDRIILIGDEPHAPYHRPPLSKNFLLTKADEVSVAMRSDTYYVEKKIDLLASTRVVAIDRAHRRLTLDGGALVGFDHLVLALGARNRPLEVPGIDHDGVFFLRSLHEARCLRTRLHEAKRMIVIGAGFIGLEVASAAIDLGLEVTVLEVASRPMSRVLSPTMSELFVREHAKRGMRFMFNTQLKRVVGDRNRVVAVETQDRDLIGTDLVLIGVGVVPNVELAIACNLEVRNGIVVDATFSTSDPNISAIGDCASFPSVHSTDEFVRHESVQNATDHAYCAAARIAGKPAPYSAVPWFWSDQGKLKLQIAGVTTHHDEAVVRGDTAGTSCSVFCFRHGRLVGVESLNRPADHIAARRLLGSRMVLSPAQAADTQLDLRRLAVGSR